MVNVSPVTGPAGHRVLADPRDMARTQTQRSPIQLNNVNVCMHLRCITIGPGTRSIEMTIGVRKMYICTVFDPANVCSQQAAQCDKTSVSYRRIAVFSLETRRLHGWWCRK